jgi:hypothetical protein
MAWDGKKFIIMVTHVDDDFSVISNEKDTINDLHKFLSNQFGEVTIKSGDLKVTLAWKCPGNRMVILNYLNLVISRNY